jgi:hypothetical protein
MGFDIKAQENVNASVHSVLNRMAKAGTITRVDIKTPNGRIARWQGPKYDKNEDIPF